MMLYSCEVMGQEKKSTVAPTPRETPNHAEMADEDYLHSIPIQQGTAIIKSYSHLPLYRCSISELHNGLGSRLI